MSERKIRILIVDDFPLVLKGLAAALGPEADMEVVGSADNGRNAVDLYRSLRPDITIMDLRLKGELTGTETVRAIRREFPEARIIMLSAYDGTEDIYQAMRAGAAAYLLKEETGDNLASLIRKVHAGGKPMSQEVAGRLAERMFQSPLTAREIEVLDLVSAGCRNKEIAERLYITENTAQGHVRSILAKLRVSDRSGAVTEGIRRGILDVRSFRAST